MIELFQLLFDRKYFLRREFWNLVHCSKELGFVFENYVTGQSIQFINQGWPSDEKFKQATERFNK